MARKKSTEFLQEIDKNNIKKGAAQHPRMKFSSLPNPDLFPMVGESTDDARYRYSISGWSQHSRTSQDKRQTSSFGMRRETLNFISCLPLMPMTKPSVKLLKQSKTHKAKILIWSELNQENIDCLNECRSYDSIKQMLADIFMLHNSQKNFRDGITLDLYYHTLQFAREEKFSPEKTSTFFAIIKKTFEVCIETPYGNLDHAYKYFKDLLLCHSVDHPPISIELFTTDEAVRISNYTLNTLFRHFKMYKYAFTPAVRLDLTLKYIGTPVSPLLPPDVEDSNAHEDEEITIDDGENESEEIDTEKLQAEKELRTIVTNFLTNEAKKIEGNIEQHLKVALDALNAKIDPLIDTGAKSVKGKKK